MCEKISIPNETMLPQVALMLAEGNSVILLTRGNSMLPFIIGDRDSVELAARPEYRTGDIVLAQLGDNRWVLHRLIGVSGEDVILKGDGNLDGTENCALQDIAGAVRCIIRGNGRKVDVTTPTFVRRSCCWRKLPRTVRRYTLGILRRVIRFI